MEWILRDRQANYCVITSIYTLSTPKVIERPT